MYAANPAPPTAELAAKALDSVGDSRFAAAWRCKARRPRKMRRFLDLSTAFR
jgi:hypothetical protein